MENSHPLIESIVQNPALCLIIWLVTILAFVFMFVLYRKNRKIKSVAYGYNNINLIRDFTSRFSKLIVAYEDRQVENITVSKIAIWNSGNMTIDKHDITEKDPLRIEINEGIDLLDTETIYYSNKALNFKHVIKGERVINIEFDYLDRNQGGIIQLIHSGIDSGPIEVLGSIKGVDRLKCISSTLLKGELSTYDAISMVASFFAGFIMLVSSVIGPFGWAVFLLGLIYIIGSLLYGYHLFRRRIPKDLEILTESFEPNKINK